MVSEYKTEGLEIYGYDMSAVHVEMWSIINVAAPYHMFIATSMQRVTQHTGWPHLFFFNGERCKKNNNWKDIYQYNNKR